MISFPCEPYISSGLRDTTHGNRYDAADALLASILRSSDDAIIAKDLNGVITVWNFGAEKVFGYPAVMMVGTRGLPLIPPDGEDAEVPVTKKIMSGESVGHFETVQKTRDGRLVDVSVTLSPIRDADGRIVGISKVARDITSRKQLEAESRKLLAELHDERTLLRTLIDSTPDLIFTKDLQGRLGISNAAHVRFAGADKESDLVGKTLFGLVPHELADLYSRDDAEVLASGQPIFNRDQRWLTRDGLARWLCTTKVPLRSRAGEITGIAEFSRDITVQTKREEVRRESEGYFRFLDELGEATRLLTEPEEIMALTARMLGGHLRASRCAYADVDPDGERFTILHDYTQDCASTVGQYHLSLFGPRVLDTLQAGQTLILRDVETELRPGNGAEMFKAIGIRAIITCPFVKGGVLRAMMAVHQTTPRDWKPSEIALVQEVVGRCWVTIERRAEGEQIQRLNTNLEQRVRSRTAELEAANKELEAFSYSVSHDLRAPLRHILGFVNLLQKNAGPALSRTSQRFLGNISAAAAQMGQLIDNLLAFSQVGRSPLQRTEIILNELVHETLEDLRGDIRERNIVWVIHDLPEVLADRALLRLALVNLISNAVKFTSTRTQARIEIGSVSNEAEDTVLFIRDNGAGFDPRYADKLFGVFQRLHSQFEFEGTGIGLANVQRIILRHGGRVWAEGAVDAGATFFFSIPKTKGGPPEH